MPMRQTGAVLGILGTPGGKLEQEESILEGAVRELRYETGVLGMLDQAAEVFTLQERFPSQILDSHPLRGVSK